MNIRVIVAAHKSYGMPKDDMYLPLHVGKEGKSDIGFIGDNTGDNISIKNPYYCELTGLYWAWKNLDAEYIGLVHYRRHFALKKAAKDKRLESVLSKKEAEERLSGCDILLPKKRNYYIENLYDHYKNTLYVEPLDITGDIIKAEYPEYHPEFEKLKTRKSAHMFNMMIMKKDKLSEYCEWLFDILGKLEGRVDNSQYDTFHARFYGRVSELLLDVWLNTKGYNYTEVPLCDIEGVNWFKKGSAFLLSKFSKKKYDKSF